MSATDQKQQIVQPTDTLEKAAQPKDVVHLALPSPPKKLMIYRAIQLVLLAVSIYIAIVSWFSPPINLCDMSDTKRDCKHEGHRKVSSILHLTYQLVLTIVILLQIVYLLNIDLTPIIATCGVLVAAIGFVVSEPLHDYVMGICFAYTKKLDLNLNVKIRLYGVSEILGPIHITNLSPLTLDGRNKNNGNEVSIRYGRILEIETINLIDSYKSTD